MLRVVFPTAIICTLTLACGAMPQSPHVYSSRQAGTMRPTLFVQNRGQAPREVLWEAIGSGFTASFYRDGFALSFTSGAQRKTAKAGAASEAAVTGGRPGLPLRPSKVVEQQISFVGASAKPPIEPLDPQPGRFSFFRGQDRSKWAAGLTTFSRLRYRNLYPGIDLVFYAKDGSLEYDFVVAAGANPGLIRLRVGDGPTRITPQGALQVGDGAQAVVHRPLLYQNLEQGKQTIEGKFVSLTANTIGFQFSSYDRRKTLVIDPALSLLYSTYLGGYHDDQATAIQLDTENNAYILGFSQSPNYPVTSNAYQPLRDNITQLIYNIVVTKMSPSGTLLYSTFVGGSNNDMSGGLVLDSSGNAYFTGATKSTDFPVTGNAYTGTFPAGAPNSAFLSELSPDGSVLLYSTFFGGSGGASGTSIAMNPQNNLVIAGSAGPGLTTSSTGYLQTISTGNAAFIAIFNPTLSGSAQLIASTYYGASNPIVNSSGTGNLALAMALDSSGNPWITGQTYTNNLPLKNAYQSATSLPTLDASCQGFGTPLNSAAYLANLSADLSTLNYASYFTGANTGGSGDACSEYGHAIALDRSGNVYVAGTTSSATFPVMGSVPQTSNPGAGGYVDFVAKFGPGSTALAWSTYLGGNGGNSFMDALTLDGHQSVWVSGATQGGTNFPLVNAFQGTEKGTYNGNVTEFSNDGTTVLFSTYLGGNGTDVAIDLALDSLDNVYIAGYTTSTNFPVTANALESQKADGGPDFNGNDIFFTILGSGAVGVVTPSSGGNTGDTTITVSGAGFQTGAACTLVQGGTTITGTVLSVSSIGTSITCSFNLNGAATGLYNVDVTNPGGSPLVTTNAFTVVSGGQPKIWTSIAGRSTFRTGFPSNFYVTYGNSGTVNAYFTEIWVSFPSQLTYQVLNPVYPTLGNASDQNPPAIVNTGTGTTFLGFLVPVLPAGSSYTLPIQFNDAGTDASLLIQSYAREPWFDSESDALTALNTAESNPSGVGTTCVPNITKTYLDNCFGDLASTVSSSVVQILDDNLAAPLVPIPAQYVSDSNSAIVALATLLMEYLEATLPTPSVSGAVDLAVNKLPGAVAQLIPSVDSQLQGRDCVTKIVESGSPTVSTGGYEQYTYNYCTAPSDSRWELDEIDPLGFGPTLSAPAGVMQAQVDPVSKVIKSLIRVKGFSGGDICDAICFPEDDYDHDRENAEDSSAADDSSSGGSVDPNDKNGLFGDGSASHYVRLVPLSYNVAFENQATATLPAQEVVITDQLDPTKVNLATLALGPISFGTTILTPPPATNNYETTVSINSSLSVRIQGSLNADTGLLKWTFTSVDPSTGLPPTDPTVGFLPPDTNGVSGQGAVVFSVAPKNTLTTGTQITNQASVVFDANAPIKTPTWLNTIDVTAPVSSVTALSATQSKTCFTVAWSGTDVGSGIVIYAIYVSDNGGPLTFWQTSTSASSAIYTGQLGHSYGFFSITIDGAGNVEQKSAADASTTINLNAATCGGLPTKTIGYVSQSPSAWGQPVTLIAQVSNGTATPPTGIVTFKLGSTVIGSGPVVNGTATYNTNGQQLAPGGNHLIAVYSGDSTDAPSTSTNYFEVLVEQATTKTSVAYSPNPAVPYETITFTATVSPQYSGTPTGTVTFYQNGVAQATVALVNGKASYSVRTLKAGTYTIKATYNGSTDFGGSSGSVKATVL